MTRNKKKTVNDYVLEYGEKYRQVFIKGLNWLDEAEKRWSSTIDRDSFVEELTRPSTFQEYLKL